MLVLTNSVSTLWGGSRCPSQQIYYKLCMVLTFCTCPTQQSLRSKFIMYICCGIILQCMLDFCRRGYMFWTEKRRKVIMKAHLDGSEPTTLVTTDVGSSGGLHMCKHIYIYATDLGTSFYRCFYINLCA